MARKATTKTTKTTAARKMGRKPPPEGEDSRGRFTRIGKRRMEQALNSIRLLGNLSSPNYACSEQDIAKMRAVLIRTMDETFARFTPRIAQASRPTFTFEAPASGNGGTVN